MYKIQKKITNFRENKTADKKIILQVLSPSFPALHCVAFLFFFFLGDRKRQKTALVAINDLDLCHFTIILTQF